MCVHTCWRISLDAIHIKLTMLRGERMGVLQICQKRRDRSKLYKDKIIKLKNMDFRCKHSVWCTTICLEDVSVILTHDGSILQVCILFKYIGTYFVLQPRKSLYRYLLSISQEVCAVRLNVCILTSSMAWLRMDRF